MSPISIGLDGLLILLLVVTFTLGLRLNGRLKGLRADHAGFAKAVAELDQALARAETGLREMRGAAAETQAALAARIQEARVAATRLDEMTARAALTPAPAPQTVIQRAAEELSTLDLGRPIPARDVPAATPIPLDARRDARSRARVDEDLFETTDAAEPVVETFPRLKFAAGGRR